MRATRLAFGSILGLLLWAPGLQAQAAPAAPTAAAAGATRPPRQSWTSSRRTIGEGDILTVLVDEHTLAAALKGANNSDTRLRDMSVRAGQSVVPTIPSVGADLSSTNAAESRQRGDLTRENRFQGEMSVRVVEVDPATGLLRIEGKKSIAVDKHQEELALSGWIRAQDVSHSNMVDSWRIADAQLSYHSTGSLGNPPKSIISRILGIFWP